MPYKLQPHVTPDMLKELGFIQTMVQMHYMRNYVYADFADSSIMFLDYFDDPESVIGDLIAKGYVTLEMVRREIKTERTADEMFTALKFTKFVSKSKLVLVEYRYHLGGSDFLTVIFYKDGTYIVVADAGRGDRIEPDLHDAIHQKVMEGRK